MHPKNIDKYFLASIVESSQDSIITIDFDLTLTSWNKAAESLYGYTATAAIGKQLTSLTLPKDLQQILANVDNVRKGRVVPAFETERVAKNGTHMILEVVVSPVKDENGAVVGVSTIARNLTERRTAEKATAEAEILRRLLVAQEDERARIARDLHDELGQQVTILRFKLSAAKEECEDEEICNRIDEIDLVAEDIDRSVDFLAWELRPALLEGMGLVSALNNYLKQWSNHSGVETAPVVSGLRGKRLEEKVEANLYRIAQEALNNIHKHAQAKAVVLVLEKQGDSVKFSVADDGKGFSPKKTGKEVKGMGLTGMKERASLIGGTFEIESTRGKGTTVYVTVPTNNQVEARGPNKLAHGQ